MKQVTSARSGPHRHRVGDGFPAHGMFGYARGGVIGPADVQSMTAGSDDARRHPTTHADN